MYRTMITRPLQCVCFEPGSTSEKRSPVKRERSRSHDSASSSLSSKASSKSPRGKDPTIGPFLFFEISNEKRSFIFN